MPSPEGIRRIVELLRRDPSVGLVVPSASLHGPETWGSNQALVEALAARIPFAFDPDALRYPAGSMYWARPWVLRRLADLQLGHEHFEPEASHVDGSTAHALERFVGVSAQASGLDVVDVADVSSRLQRRRRAADPATEGSRLLPAAVPSDPRERRLVGNRVHRLGERRSGTARLRGTSAAGGAWRARPVRPVEYRGDAPPVVPGQGVRRRRIRHVPLLVRREEAPRHAVAQPTRRSDDRLPVRALLGERELDATLGRPRLRRSDPSELQRGLGRPVLRRHRPGAQRPALHHRRRAASARPLSHRPDQGRPRGDRTMEGARAGRRTRRPPRARGRSRPAFRGTAPRRRGRHRRPRPVPAAHRDRAPVGQERSPPAYLAPTRATSTPTTRRSTAPISRR